MEWLSIVAKHHKEWVTVVRSWGMGELSEDIVQEMYLKLHDKVNPEKIIQEGHVNKYFIYVVLRNMFTDYHRERSKVEKTRIGIGFEILDEQTDLSKLEAYEKIIDRVYEGVESLHWYDRMMLNTYTKTDMSMRDIERETNISLTSIYNTIKNCRKQITDHCGEDWEDFTNKDYEKI